MLGSLPTTIDPIQLAEKGSRLVGRLSVRTMSRLRALLQDDAGEAEIDLAFERTGSTRVRRMYGRIVVPAVSVVCQRCLEPMQIALSAQPDAILLREGEPDEGAPPEADTLSFGDARGEGVSLADLVEDELLLVMPMVPMHAIDACPGRKYIADRHVDRTAGSAGEKATQRPFAELARTKRGTERDS